MFETIKNYLEKKNAFTSLIFYLSKALQKWVTKCSKLAKWNYCFVLVYPFVFYTTITKKCGQDVADIISYQYLNIQFIDWEKEDKYYVHPANDVSPMIVKLMDGLKFDSSDSSSF